MDTEYIEYLEDGIKSLGSFKQLLAIQMLTGRRNQADETLAEIFNTIDDLNEKIVKENSAG